MIALRRIVASVFCLAVALSAQTAEELVAKNIEAKGGMEKLKAIKTVRTTADFDAGGFKAVIGQESKRPDMVRDSFTLQGMTEVDAYDGAVGWHISPFQGKKDPELMGEDQLHGMIEEADFDGPLVDYKTKGNTVEYLGHDQVDGDDVYKLKATLKNGDIYYYYLDPDTYLEILVEKQIFIRGSVRESATEYGSYKPVNGVMYAFSMAQGSKNDPDGRAKINVKKIEVNVPIDDGKFKMPSAPQKKAPEKAPTK